MARAKGRPFEGAYNGYIFYDRLKQSEDASLVGLYNRAARDFSGAENAMNITHENLDKYASNLQSLALAERKKEIKFLERYGIIDLNPSKLEDMSENKQIIRFFNDAVGIAQGWRDTIERVKKLDNAMTENPEGYHYQGIKERNLVEERLRYFIEQEVNDKREAWLNEVFKDIIPTEESIRSMAKNKDFNLSELTNKVVEDIENFFLNNEPNAKNNTFKKSWETFMDKCIDSAFVKLDHQYKREKTETINDEKINREWTAVKEMFQKNDQLRNKFKSAYSANLAIDFTELHQAIKDKMNGINSNNIRGVKSALKEYKKIVKRGSKAIKPSASTGKKRKLSDRAEIAEIIQSILIEGIESPNIKVISSTTRSVSTRADADVIGAISSKITIETKSLEEFAKTLPQFQAKEEGKLKQMNKEQISELIHEYEQYILNIDSDAMFYYGSTKSYDLGWFFQHNKHGFSGPKLSYSTAVNVFSKLTNSSPEAMKLYFGKLMNTMEGAMFGELSYMKEKETRRMSFNMAKHIGALMFDDMYATATKETNSDHAIHIFFLADIVVPLSVFLMALSKAMKTLTTESGVDKLLEISYTNSSSILYKTDEQVPDDQSGWGEQRSQAIKDFNIVISFYSNFIQEVRNFI